MKLMHRLFEMIASMLETEGRELRDQVYRVCLSLIILCVAILLAIVGVVIGGLAVYYGLRQIMGPAQAMGVLTLLVMIIAGALIILGCRVYPGHPSHQKKQASQTEAGDGHLYHPHHDSAGRPMSTWSQQTMPHDLRAILPGHHGGPTAMPVSPIETVQRTVEQSKDLIRKHPVAAAGVAFGLGMVLSRSSMARNAVKLGVLWGGRQCVNHFLFPPQKHE